MSGPARPAESEPGRRTEFRADSQPRPLSRRASVLVLSQALAGRAAGRSRRSRDASHFKFAFGFGSVSTVRQCREPQPAHKPGASVSVTVLKTWASGKDWAGKNFFSTSVFLIFCCYCDGEERTVGWTCGQAQAKRRHILLFVSLGAG